jgi:hypothetical protein
MSKPQPQQDEQAQAPRKSVPWAQLKNMHANARQTVMLCVRGDLVDEISRLEELMRREDEADQNLNRHPVAPQIARQIQALEAEAREAEAEFTFQGLGQGQFAKLQAAHPATAENKKTLGTDDLEWNPDTFPPALMAASCIAPPELAGNVEEWTEIHQNWSNGQVLRLWATCMAANAMGADTPKSRHASDLLRRLDSANNSTTASH